MPSLNWSTIDRWISCHGVCDAGTGKPPAFSSAFLRSADIFVADQHVGGPFVEVDPHTVTGLDEGEPHPRGRLWGGVEDRRGAEGPDWRPSPTQQAVDAFLMASRRRLHVDDFGTSRVTGVRPGASDDKHAVLVYIQCGVFDAGVVVLRALKDDDSSALGRRWGARGPIGSAGGTRR